MTEKMRSWNWSAIGFFIQMAAMVWMAAVAYTKLDYVIAKVDKMEGREYTKDAAQRDWENQRLQNAMAETRLRNLEDFKKWRNEK